MMKRLFILLIVVSGCSGENKNEIERTIDTAGNVSVVSNKISFTNLTSSLVSGPLNPSNDVKTETIEWSTTDFWADLYPESGTYSPFTVRGDTLYWVYLDGNRRPKVGRMQFGQAASTVFLEASDYLPRNDNHSRFSIGIAPDGYIHITGDMHNYNSNVRNRDWMPSRFQDGTIMQWISDKPWDISSWTWQGENVALKLPGYGFTYVSFFNDVHGELYAQGRQRVYDSSHSPGEMGFAIWRYNHGTREWASLGGLAPHSTKSTTYNSLVWEEGAHVKQATNPNFYQGFQSNARFDFNNRLHLSAAVAAEPNLDRATHLVYAYSDDGGFTWKQADDDAITTLPIRVASGVAQGDVVLNFELSDMTSVAGMPNGEPIILYNDSPGGGGNNAEYAYFNGSTWEIANNDPLGGSTKNSIHIDTNGVFTFVRHNSNDIRRTKDLAETPYLIEVGDKFCCVDDMTTRETGDIFGLVLSGNELQIVRLSFSNALSPIWP